MAKMSKFSQGWWNCFHSFAAEIRAYAASSEMEIVMRNVLDGAGVTKEEINQALKTEISDERIINYLNEYKKGL